MPIHYNLSIYMGLQKNKKTTNNKRYFECTNFESLIHIQSLTWKPASTLF